MDVFELKKAEGWLTEAFTINLKTRSDDPELKVSPVPTFAHFPILGIPCIPHIGVYGEDYFPSLPLAIIELPYIDKVEILPAMKAYTSEYLEKEKIEDDCVDFNFLIHSTPRFAECQKFTCNNTDEFNIMYHAWAFSDQEYLPDVAHTDTLEIGVFNPHNVKGVHLDLKDSGVSINEMRQYSVVIHDLAFSPENVKLQANRAGDFACFFSLAFQPSKKRATASFHLIPLKDSSNEILSQICLSSMSLKDLIHGLQGVQDDVVKHSAGTLKSIIESISDTKIGTNL